MGDMKMKQVIENGTTSLGIEFGSTRIKAVLIDDSYLPIASGSFEWSNSQIDDIWTYSIDEIWMGIQTSFKELKEEVKKQYDADLKTVGAIGISAMMHGYLVFDSKEELLTPFRTWRNNITGEASEKLTEVLNYPIPQRWSIAHLYQAILNEEEHVKNIQFMTTLAGYVHWKLTGEKVIGVGDGSGMFPIDLQTSNYNESMVNSFNGLIEEKGFGWKLSDIMPKVLVAGEGAGTLSEEGARLLDPTGELESGILFCPPEGDAGTGMVATNSVGVRTGNVSAGTSVFAMIVLEDELKKVHAEIDQVTTPSGKLVAMAHSNNCTTELNSWVNLFGETLKTFGVEVDANTLYGTLYKKAMQGDADCGGLLSYGYHSGEHITHFEEGRPLLVRKADSSFNLGNLMRANLYTSIGTLKIGLDILLKEEGVKLDKMLGHGGLFKTENVGQQIMADAIEVPVSVMDTAGEGGAWGIAILAAYAKSSNDQTLDVFLQNEIFGNMPTKTLEPTTEGAAGFKSFMNRFKAGLGIERAAVLLLS